MENARSSPVATIPPDTPAPSESEERYRTLVEAAREIICTVSTDGRFTSINRAFRVLTGWPGEDWLGRSYTGVVHPDDLASCAAAF